MKHAALFVGLTWWGLGIAAAFGGYVAIVVHEYRSADSLSRFGTSPIRGHASRKDRDPVKPDLAEAIRSGG